MDALNKDQFSDALQKGQGRVLLYLRQYGIGEWREVLLNACLKDLAYDPQCEESRDEWLMSLIGLAGGEEYYREHIVGALAERAQDWDLRQLLNLARDFARRGDGEARRAIYARFDGQASRESWLGAEQIVALDGIGGLLHVAEVVGSRPLDDSDPWQAECLMRQASRIHGEEAVDGALRQRAETSTAVRFFLDAAARAKKQYAQGRAAPRVRPSLERILADIEGAVGQFPGHFTVFGRTATEKELDTVFERLLSESRTAQRLRCLWVFRRRAFPRLDLRLLALMEAGDDETRTAAIAAFSEVHDPLVHDLAVRLLRDSPGLITSGAIRLFMHNYHPGDDQLIKTALPSSGSSLTIHERHQIGCDLIKVGKVWTDPGLAPCLEWVYEHSPCSYCRGQALQRLAERGCASSRFLDEAIWDCSPRTREIAQKAKREQMSPRRGESLSHASVAPPLVQRHQRRADGL